MSELNKIISIKTHYEYEMACDECNLTVNPESCDGCSGVLFERADYRKGNEIIHIETKVAYVHFCTKECAEEYLERKHLEVKK